MICLYLKIPENFARRILQNGFCVVYIPFVLYGLISIFCTIPRGSPSPPSRVLFLVTILNNDNDYNNRTITRKYNEKKNNCMDISSEKQFHKKRLG